MERPLGMALALRPRNWVSPSLGAVEGGRKRLAARVQRVVQAAELGVPPGSAQSPAGQ